MRTELVDLLLVKIDRCLSSCGPCGTKERISGSWKLYSTVGFERVFIAPDEPLDARRRRTLDRLKKKATDQGKHVAVTDGVLYVDSVKVFSLQQGFSQQRDD